MGCRPPHGTTPTHLEAGPGEAGVMFEQSDDEPAAGARLVLGAVRQHGGEQPARPGAAVLQAHLDAPLGAVELDAPGAARRQRDAHLAAGVPPLVRHGRQRHSRCLTKVSTDCH